MAPRDLGGAPPRRDVYVGGTLARYDRALQARNNDLRTPDFVVVSDAIEDPQRRRGVVWQESGRTPEVVLALLRASTEREDRGRKRSIYAGLKVSERSPYDAQDERPEGYRLMGRDHVRIAP